MLILAEKMSTIFCLRLDRNYHTLSVIPVYRILGVAYPLNQYIQYPRGVAG